MVDQTRLESLKAKLAASERMGSGYSDRIAALKAEIDKLEKAKAD